MKGYILFVAAAVALAAIERLYALRNERRLRAAGAREIAPEVFLWMVPIYALHFAGALLERGWRGAPPAIGWTVAMAGLFVASKALKLWAIRSLGRLWTMRVFIPSPPVVVTSGPYRFLRHPNYVAVIGEILGLTLAGGAWRTAALCGGAFALILRRRVRSEEAALFGIPEYAACMTMRRRFLPGAGR
jgi:methyltransferase